MKVKFSFDTTAVERRGFTLEDVHRTIKNLFTAHDFPCVSDGDALAFRDKGHGDDFATMWDIILSLLRSDWFMDCAASCVWLDEDGEEDIVTQVGKVQKKGALLTPGIPFYRKQGESITPDRGQELHRKVIVPLSFQ